MQRACKRLASSLQVASRWLALRLTLLTPWRSWRRASESALRPLCGPPHKRRSRTSTFGRRRSPRTSPLPEGGGQGEGNQGAGLHRHRLGLESGDSFRSFGGVRRVRRSRSSRWRLKRVGRCRLGMWFGSRRKTFSASAATAVTMNLSNFNIGRLPSARSPQSALPGVSPFRVRTIGASEPMCGGSVAPSHGNRAFRK